MTSIARRPAGRLRPAAGIVLMAILVAACSGSSTPAPAGTAAPSTAARATTPGSVASPAATPAGTGGPSGTFVVGPFRLTPGPDLCSLLKPDDFTAAGVTGAGTPTRNNPDPNDFFCVYAGKSSATGGIEFDAFISDPLPADDTTMSMNGFGNVDVTAEVGGADKALYNDDPVPTIGVRSGNFVFLIGYPASATARAAAPALATLVLARATAMGH
jgi:hypothetical protein